MSTEQTAIHLGNNLYATVRTFQKEVKFHIRKFLPSETASTQIVPTKWGITLNKEQFTKLIQNQLSLTNDYYSQTQQLKTQQNIDEQIKLLRHGNGQESRQREYQKYPPENQQQQQQQQQHGQGTQFGYHQFYEPQAWL